MHRSERDKPQEQRAIHTGPRVILRYPVKGDRDAYVRIRRESRSLHEAWEPLPPRGFDPYSGQGFDRDLLGCRAPEREALLVCLKDSGQMVGRVAFQQIIRGPLQQCFLGYWVSSSHAGQGYMKEAIGLALRHAFITLGLNRVEANIQPDNMASRAVVRANGFRLEGFSPRYLKIQGRWQDHERWAMDAGEWNLQTRGS